MRRLRIIVLDGRALARFGFEVFCRSRFGRFEVILNEVGGEEKG